MTDATLVASPDLLLPYGLAPDAPPIAISDAKVTIFLSDNGRAQHRG